MENRNEESNENKENIDKDKENTEKTNENNKPLTETTLSENKLNEIKNDTPPLTTMEEKNTEEIKTEKKSPNEENTNSILDNLITIQKLSKKNMSLKQLCKLYIIIFKNSLNSQ